MYGSKQKNNGKKSEKQLKENIIKEINTIHKVFIIQFFLINS